MQHRPRFKHDCDGCTFIGQLAAHDIYTCPQGGVMPTVIARWGDDGPEYTSGPDLSYLYAIELTPTIEPRHLRQTWLQIEAHAFALAEEWSGQKEDTEFTRYSGACAILGRLMYMYAAGYLDEKPVLEDVKRRLDTKLVSHA